VYSGARARGSPGLPGAPLDETVQSDEPGDVLFLLALAEAAAALVAAYALVLLALYGAPRSHWVPHLVLFGVAASALLATSAVADLRHRRSTRQR
jgi:hypothetical protein